MVLGTPDVPHMVRFTDLAVLILVCLGMDATRRDTWKCHRNTSTMSRDRMDPDMWQVVVVARSEETSNSKPGVAATRLVQSRNAKSCPVVVVLLRTSHIAQPFSPSSHLQRMTLLRSRHNERSLFGELSRSKRSSLMALSLV
ncbi:unnamed protein product [Mycena citricolor]|uniref:Secreted protein n=1 Tax=Mycena citricolor TaxID=2018698 RepID=A0AAD2HFS5_9AGAR|nr:unnamed protein product [Mycena citricolor]